MMNTDTEIAHLRAQVGRLKARIEREREKARRRQLRWVCDAEMRNGRNRHIRSALDHFAWACMARRYYQVHHDAAHAAEHARRLAWSTDDRIAAHAAGQGVPR